MVKCSGCGTCAAICPVKCIEMKVDQEGFLRPITHSGVCTHCGACEKVCPMIQVESQNLDKGILFSAQAHDKNILSISSSGGVASILAEYGIRHGYAVCGVVLNYNTMKAEHCIIRNLADIWKLSGSKYLQSESTEAFKQVFNELKEIYDSRFMIFGTPCQIAGLRKALAIRGWLGRVLLIDIFCHGVPSDLLWNKYKGWIVEKMRIKSIYDVKKLTFREKKYSWHLYHMSITIGGGYFLCG